MHKQDLVKLVLRALDVAGVSFTDGTTFRDVLDKFDLHDPAFLNLITEVNALSFATIERNILPFVVFKKTNENMILITDVDGDMNFSEVSNASALMYVVRAMENVFGAEIGHDITCDKQRIIDNYWQYSSAYKPGEVISVVERAQQVISEALTFATNQILSNTAQGALKPEDVSINELLGISEIDEDLNRNISNADGSANPFSLKV